MRNVNWNQPQVRGYPQEIAGLTKDVKGLLLTIVPGSFSWLGPICPPITASRVAHSVLPNQWSPHIPLAVGVCGWCFLLKQQFFCEKELAWNLESCHVPWHDIPPKKKKKNISKWITTLSVKYKRSHNFMVRGNYIPSRLQKILQPQQFNSSIAPIHLCHLQKLHGHFRPPEPWQKIWPVEWPPKIRENPFFKVR